MTSPSLSDNAEQHLEHLRLVFETINKYGIKLRLDKCLFAAEETEYLGYYVNKYGYKPTNKYKKKILDVPKPTSRDEMQQFLGLVAYLNQFLPDLHDIAKPLYALLKKDVPFAMNAIRNAAFIKIKALVQSADYLIHPDLTLNAGGDLKREFHVFCDASINGIGGVIGQYNDENVFEPIAFASKAFNTTQQNWHVSEQEIFSCIYMVEKWRSLLLGSHFVVHTDHKNLEELFNRSKRFRAGKLYRWAVRLQEFDFTAEYVPGYKNTVADYLSRNECKRLENGHKNIHYLNEDRHARKAAMHNIFMAYMLHHSSTTLNGCDEIDNGSEVYF